MPLSSALPPHPYSETTMPPPRLAMASTSTCAEASGRHRDASCAVERIEASCQCGRSDEGISCCCLSIAARWPPYLEQLQLVGDLVDGSAQLLCEAAARSAKLLRQQLAAACRPRRRAGMPAGACLRQCAALTRFVNRVHRWVCRHPHEVQRLVEQGLIGAGLRLVGQQLGAVLAEQVVGEVGAEQEPRGSLLELRNHREVAAGVVAERVLHLSPQHQLEHSLGIELLGVHGCLGQRQQGRVVVRGVGRLGAVHLEGVKVELRPPFASVAAVAVQPVGMGPQGQCETRSPGGSAPLCFSLDYYHRAHPCSREHRRRPHLGLRVMARVKPAFAAAMMQL
jgi:hypothetical protein